MRKAILLLTIQLVVSTFSSGQKVFYKIDFGGNAASGISCIQQDQLGYIWLTALGKGLLKYDGSKFISYTHNDKDTNSISNAKLETLFIDSSGILWIGTLGGGMDEFDPAANIFRHFRHHPNDAKSLSNDSVHAILRDHLGNLWIGTARGLDRYDNKTGKFIHYMHSAKNTNSLSGTHVRVLYEDKEGNLWVGCGSPFPNEESWKDEGGLNRFDRTTGTFTRFLHDPNDPSSIANNKVRALLEDSKGNFWVGTGGDGLQTLNRQTGKFTHYYYDSTHPENLSRGPLFKSITYDHITFIKEDVRGNIWIGTLAEGINEYNPQTKKIIHHGYSSQPGKLIAADTSTGFNDGVPWCALTAKDGLVWIATLTSGNLYKVDFNKNIVLPHDRVVGGGNAFYKDSDGTVWIATNNGIIRKDERTGKQKIFLQYLYNPNSTNNIILGIEPDGKGSLWVATYGSGLEKFNPATEQFKYYSLDSTRTETDKDTVQVVRQDAYGNLWVGFYNKGLAKIDKATGKISRFKYIANNSSKGLASNNVISVRGDKNAMWVATGSGLDKIEISSGKVSHYLQPNTVTSVVIDKRGVIWAGTQSSLYRYDVSKNTFVVFKDPAIEIGKVISLNVDKNNNIWVASGNAIFEIKNDQQHISIYNADNSVQPIAWTANNDYISADGEVFIGDTSGYYHFYADSVQQQENKTQVNFASLQIGGKEVSSGEGSILNQPLYRSEEIKIPDSKNSFSITFSAIDFHSTGENKIVYMLENYDNQWHETGSDYTAYFYNLPVGHYILRVRAINAHGAWSEKKLSIIITPPWWQTWWAIISFIVLLVAVILAFSYYRSYSLRKENKILEEKIKRRTVQLEQSLENLRSTQNQLVQQEKMASLGELTAGIAHEIQNPLNFVNNFSEVNKEMIGELKEEITKGNYNEVKIIADNIEANEEKINHHGKRADAIVKGMLQHSRQSSGTKEQTDINALCDEYLRLSYHGLRARDKSFNADFKTDFDETIGKINIVPQNIGRVLLNLFNNAFYAVNEKQKTADENYRPLVTIATNSLSFGEGRGEVVITVADNGNGIPQNIVDKIFQPFFTTKPTGQGTGLGLSLSYDIIKAHGGEIKVETKEGEGSWFEIQLPLTK